MAYYLVRAEPTWERLAELAERLNTGEVKAMQPFGRALHAGLTGARRLSEEQAIWEEEDYCRPPLRQERAAVLDEYFSSIQVEKINPGQGWRQIEGLPSMWPADIAPKE